MAGRYQVRRSEWCCGGGSDMAWRVLVIDDEPDICAQVADHLSDFRPPPGDEPTIVETTSDFDEGLHRLDGRRVDVVIIDVRRGSGPEANGSEAGLQMLQSVMQRRFLPVIFYTALPNQIPEEIRSPLVQVVTKNPTSLLTLEESLRSVFATGLPQVHRALQDHVDAVQRDYMWDFVSEHWGAFGAADKTSLAYFLARRLAHSLSGAAIDRLVEALPGEGDPAVVREEKVHPMRMYLVPPVDGTDPQTGEILKGTVADRVSHWILLTPSCDIAQRKAERVLLAHCIPLETYPAYMSFKAGESTSNRDRLTRLLGNAQSDRYFFLPAVLETVPDLVVDLQDLEGLPCDSLGAMTRVATVDSPFAEAITARFIRYFGRLGTPDVDLDMVLNRLRMSGALSLHPQSGAQAQPDPANPRRRDDSSEASAQPDPRE